MNQRISKWAAKGVKVHQALFTLGKYDQVWVWEAPDERVGMQTLMDNPDISITQTMVALSRDEVNSWIK